MRYWYFSETAYPHLPDLDTISSLRVTLPNGIVDPRKAADLWHRYIDDWQAAEHHGFGLMINEHHSTATCMNPAAPIIAGILARCTETARILVLGNPIANRPDPVRVAEEMALVDVISRGRLECGFVRGVPYEISATNSSPVAMTDRFWEAHDLIVKAWTTHDGPFSWTGRFFEHRQVNIWPRPYQQPHPPLWITTLNPSSAPAIADRGYTLATFMQGKATRAIFASYRERRAELGLESRPDQLAYCGLVYVGEDDEAARAGAERLMWYPRTNKSAPPFEAPPGYMPPAARVGTLTGAGSPLGALTKMSQEEMIEEGILFAGDPDTVFEQLRRFYEHVGGFGHLILLGQAGFLGHEETVNSLRLFSQEVAPRLDELAAAGAPATAV